MNTYPISTHNKQQEMQHINKILKNNYPQNIQKYNNKKHTHIPQKTKWATFTYIGKETRTITKLFKKSNIHIAFKTNNSLQKQLQYKKPLENKYNKSGIYQLNCQNCQMKYIGQTGRNFKTRYTEHIKAIQNNQEQKSKFAQHILETQHTYSTIEHTMDILHFQNKGMIMNTLERYHIYQLTKKGTQLNDTYTETYNPIFNILNKHYTHSNTPT
jgi:hypothetical protein